MGLGEIGVALLERERELGRIAAAIAAVQGGEGRALYVKGPAGIGKTALLDAARDLAGGAGWIVLAARGGELERDFAHGVVRQLYEPRLREADPKERHKLLGGAARPAAAVLLRSDREAAGRITDAFAVHHALYWLTAALADERPVLLVVDDAHWADEESLRFLYHLAARLEGLSVLVAVAARPGQDGPTAELLDAVGSAPGAETLWPAALSLGATGGLLARLAGEDASEGLVAACHEVTGGNAFMLAELVRALTHGGSSLQVADVERVRELGPRTIARSVLGRLGVMRPDALALGRAVAVLDTDAELRHAAALAGLDLPSALAAADALSEAQILAPGRPLRFIHPIMRRAVYDDLPEGRRAVDHEMAARRLDAEGGDPDRAAAHLLACEPAADRWAAERLRSAAARAMARGAPSAAVRLLRRALAEPPPREHRAAVMFDLGRAERRAGNPTAIEHLRLAIEQTETESLAVGWARELAYAQLLNGDVEDAVSTFRTMLGNVGERDRSAAQLLSADLLVARALDTSPDSGMSGELERLSARLEGRDHAERALLAALANDRLRRRAGPVQEIASLAERALRGDPFDPDGPVGEYHPWVAVSTLVYADHHQTVAAALDRMMTFARVHGSAFQTMGVLAWRARLATVRGEILDGEDYARRALALSTGADVMTTHVLASLVFALIERGQLAEAESALAAYGLDAVPLPPTTVGELLYARAALRLEQGRVADAIGDTEATLRAWGGGRGLNPGSYRTSPVLALRAAGRQQEAREIAGAQLQLVRHIEIPSAIGTATMMLGIATGGEEGTALLGQAADTLRDTPRRLDYARALIEFGSALRRAKRRVDSRPPLQEGMEIAHRCGATVLASQAREELRATGARPRRMVVTGADSLTASELRVARMAADGMSNPQIAQTLYVTRRTVETHLASSYRKLDIGSREELADALADRHQAGAAPV